MKTLFRDKWNSLSDFNAIENQKTDLFLETKKFQKIIIPVVEEEEKLKRKKTIKNKKKNKKTKKNKVKGKDNEIKKTLEKPVEEKKKDKNVLTQIEKDLISIEYLEIMKKDYPLLFKKFINQQITEKNFKDFLENNKNWQNMVKKKKKILEDILNPKKFFDFKPIIDENSKKIHLRSLSSTIKKTKKLKKKKKKFD